MKKLLFVFFFLAIATVAYPQFNGIADALNQGNATALAKFFDDKVEISVPNVESTYDKAKAEEVIAKFFQECKPSGFKLMHQGTSKGKASEYGIGSLSAAGKTYRVFIYLSEVGAKSAIQQIQFEAE